MSTTEQALLIAEIAANIEDGAVLLTPAVSAGPYATATAQDVTYAVITRRGVLTGTAEDTARRLVLLVGPDAAQAALSAAYAECDAPDFADLEPLPFEPAPSDLWDTSVAAPDEIPLELVPIVSAFADAWERRAEALARVAEALSPGHRCPRYVAGQRVEVTFGPNAGKIGTLTRGEPDAHGLYHIQLDDGSVDEWGGFWYHVAGEFRVVSSAGPRPWANDAAYAALG